MATLNYINPIEKKYFKKTSMVIKKNTFNFLKYIFQNIQDKFGESVLNLEFSYLNNQNFLEEINNINQNNIKELLYKIYKQESHQKLHLYDTNGTIAIIHIDTNKAWLNPYRTQSHTDHTLNYEIANLNALSKVNRKDTIVLNDWLWNLIWNSPALAVALVPEDGHYKIDYWPKPFDKNNKKQIFQLSACFVQGAKISTVSKQFNIDETFIKRFTGANIAIHNCQKISIWDKHFSPPIQEEIEEQNFIQSFFGKLRQKLRL